MKSLFGNYALPCAHTNTLPHARAFESVACLAILI
jgi:hypothetical protein